MASFAASHEGKRTGKGVILCHPKGEHHRKMALECVCVRPVLRSLPLSAVAVGCSTHLGLGPGMDSTRYIYTTIGALLHPCPLLSFCLGHDNTNHRWRVDRPGRPKEASVAAACCTALLAADCGHSGSCCWTCR